MSITVRQFEMGVGNYRPEENIILAKGVKVCQFVIQHFKKKLTKASKDGLIGCET